MTFDWSVYTGNLDWLPRRTILLTRHGSHAYGTSTPESDIDLRGICIAPRSHYLGFAKSFEQAEQHEPVDLTVFDLRKFFRLASACNPNVLELLFTDPSDHLVTRPEADQLIFCRDMFLSRRAKHTFSGYAHAQLARIRGQSQRSTSNPAREARKQEHGYDTKHAMHLVRLLRMCRELLTDGTFHVRRPDAAELLAIRNGAWSLSELEQYAEEQDRELTELVARSPLPERPNLAALDALCERITTGWL